MREISVDITKAKIKSFHVDLKDDKPDVRAEVSLMTADGKEISTFCVNSHGYYAGPKFEVPFTMIPSILVLGDELERIVVNCCKREMAQLPSPENEVKISDSIKTQSDYIPF